MRFNYRGTDKTRKPSEILIRRPLAARPMLLSERAGDTGRAHFYRCE